MYAFTVTNFAYTWETSEIHTRTKYKAGTGHEITADIGVHIGLRGINITLKGNSGAYTVYLAKARDKACLPVKMKLVRLLNGLYFCLATHKILAVYYLAMYIPS